MLNIGPLELVAISIVALLVLGPEKLPGAVRTVGRALGELRRISSGFQNEMREAFEQSELEQQMRSRADQPPPSSLTDTPAPVVDRPDEESDGEPDDGAPDLADPVTGRWGDEPDDGAVEPAAAGPTEASAAGAGTEPTTATKAATPAGADPGKDDDGASESQSQSEQDSQTPPPSPVDPTPPGS